MADEGLIASPALSPSAVSDSHKRKLEDLELNDAPEPFNESETSQGAAPAKNGGSDESEAKRLCLDTTNGDTVSETDGLVSQNGHQEKEQEDNRKGEEAELPASANDNGQSVVGQEAVEESLETITEEPSSNVTEHPENESLEELGQTKADDEERQTKADDEKQQTEANNEEPSEEPPSRGDIPNPSAEMQPGSDTQLVSRKMEVPNDKVGVLIGKAGDTIRSLQDNSGAKIQIMKDAEVDPGSTTRPVELVGTWQSINKAEKLIKDVIAEADAGGSPSLVARGFSIAQAAAGGEQLEIQVPIEKVGVILGKGGETIRNLQTRSGARIQLLQQNLSDGDQSKERTVRLTGNKKQIETAREMIKDVIHQTKRPSPLSGGYNQHNFRPRGPVPPRGSHRSEYSGYDYPQRGPYPSQGSQYPPPMYNYPPQQAPRSNFGPSWEQRPPASLHGPSPQSIYNYGQHQGPSPTPAQHFGHMGSQSTPYPQGGTHMGSVPQDQFKPPMYGIQPQVPQSQSYVQTRPIQPGQAPYQGPISSTTQSYGSNVPTQQSYPYASSGPVQQTYPSYGSVPASGGYVQAPPSSASASGYPSYGSQPVAAYSQPVAQQAPAYPQAGATGGYGSYPTAQPGYVQQQPAAYNAAYGYQGAADPTYGGAQGTAATYPAAATAAAPAPAGQSGYVQPSQTQPSYDQSGGYGSVPAPAAYDSSQTYTAPH